MTKFFSSMRAGHDVGPQQSPWRDAVMRVHPEDPSEAIAYMKLTGIYDVALSRWLRTRAATHPFMALLSAIWCAAWSEVKPLLDRLETDGIEFDHLHVLRKAIRHGRPMNVYLQRPLLHRLLAPLALDEHEYGNLFAIAVRAGNAMAAFELLPHVHHAITSDTLRACVALEDPQLMRALLARDDVDPLTMLGAREIRWLCTNEFVCDYLRANRFVRAAVEAGSVWFTYTMRVRQ